MKMNAELGAERAHVIPHPRYNPRIPYWRHIAAPSCTKVFLLCVPPTGEVCIRDLMVSAGKKRKLYETPADAPATACCQSGSGFSRISRLSASDDAFLAAMR